VITRPLISNKKRNGEASSFHKKVFARWGSRCWFGHKHADDAAHVVDKNQLGNKRYCDPEIARPLCRPCHIQQTDGMISFSLADRRAATLVANKYMKQKLVVPTR